MKHLSWLRIALFAVAILALTGCASSPNYRYYGQRYPAVYGTAYPVYGPSYQLYRLQERERAREWRRLQREQERYQREQHRHWRQYRH